MWRVRNFYIDARTMQAAEKDGSGMGVAIPNGWEPIGGDIETGGALRLILAREEDDGSIRIKKAEGMPRHTRPRRTNGELDD